MTTIGANYQGRLQQSRKLKPTAKESDLELFQVDVTDCGVKFPLSEETTLSLLCIMFPGKQNKVK